MPGLVSFCVVNTEQRELLLVCLDAIERERATLAEETEVIVLDNASRDGSADAARAHPSHPTVIALERREGWSANVNTVLQAARGDYCVLLNEDAELLPGAVLALHEALDTHPTVAMAAAALYRPDGTQQPSAWWFPTVGSALLNAAYVGRWVTVQSRGPETREVQWAQSCTMIVRRSAVEEVGWWDPDFFVYSDEVDVQRRLRDRGWRTLYVPSARATHHEQLSTGSVPERRIVEFSRNRDRYMRKHHSRAEALAVRVLTAWTYAVRALVALVLPGHDPHRYWRHATATMWPQRGEGLREAAAEYNRAPRV